LRRSGGCVTEWLWVLSPPMLLTWLLDRAVTAVATLFLRLLVA